MSVQTTILIGDSVLRETALLVTNFTDPIVAQTVTDLVDTMRANDLAAIAAPQIGVSLAIFISEIRETKYRTGETDELRIYINPEIVEVSHETELGWEGCGSIPGLFGEVQRSTEVMFNYIDESGVSREMTTTGLLARIIQHEVDHLNGVLFTDLADPKTFVSSDYYIEHILGK